MISDTLSESDFAEQLNIRIWEKLSRFNWLPFEEVNEWVKRFNFKSQKDWYMFSKSDKFPKDVPSAPYYTYKNQGWKNWGTFLGTGFVSNSNRVFKSFIEAKEYILDFNIKTKSEYISMHKKKMFTQDIPYNPRRTYLNDGWVSWGDFLGTGNIASFNIEYLSYNDAKKKVKGLGLKNWTAWRNYTKSKNFPKDIPKKPYNTYKNKGWVDMLTFLSSKETHKKTLKPINFESARRFARNLNFQNGQEWLAFADSKKKPSNIPKYPNSVYKNEGWISMYDWLGINKNDYVSYEEAKKYLRKFNLKSWADYREFTKSPNRPSNIPGHPHIIYKNKGWVSISDLLGYESKSTARVFREFKDAKEFVHKLKLKNQIEWQKFVKSNLKPNDIPSSPQKVYKDKGWNGLEDWLGKE